MEVRAPADPSIAGTRLRHQERTPGPAGSTRRSSLPLLAWMVPLVGLAFLVTLVAIGIGAVSVPHGTTWGIVLDHLVPGSVERSWTAVEDRIIWEFRLPRALLAIFVGAALALAGTVLQALVRNPLAEPFLLGVSSGASLGAVMVLVLGSSAVGGLSLAGAAFAGALVAMVLVYVFAQRSGRITPARLLLAGVALAFLFQALYSFVLQKAQSGQAAQSILFWLLGSLGGARWESLLIPVVAIVAGSIVLALQVRPLNALLVGEETASSLGINVPRLRLLLFVLTSLLVGVIVAVSGAIAFVGLIVPHAARLLVGADHRRALPVAVVLGAIFVQLADIAARTLAAPQELPLSIVTALVGVPFFLWLMRRSVLDRAVASA